MDIKLNKRGKKASVNGKNRASGFMLLKLFFLLSIFSVLFFPLISAVEVDMNSEFSSGETLLARFSGNFIDQITPENVVFYRGHVGIPMVYNVVKINDEFYIYALLTGKTEGNYSISIEGVRYMKATEIVDNHIVSNFSISNSTAEFSVNPGALTAEDDFSVEIQNLQDRKIVVEIDENSSIIVSQNSLELKSGEKKTLFFTVGEISKKTLEKIEFSSGNFSYELPVYLNTNETSSAGENRFEFQPSSVEISMATDSNTKRALYLTNTGDEDIDDISFNISSVLEPYIEISPKEIGTLDAGSSEKIQIEITSDLEEAIIEGKITAYTKNLSSSLTLILNFAEDFIPTEVVDENGTVIITTCEELNGTICTENKECSGETQYAKDGVCCTASCEEKKAGSSGKITGWLILALVIIIVIWFIKRKYLGVGRRKPF
ncbi:MAG: hypothetical protein NTW17_03145 [Candidatus Pacearchaeota archaeon]|nr:hypothetical protein [Candidatus Pacearchaeota archaeon]